MSLVAWVSPLASRATQRRVLTAASDGWMDKAHRWASPSMCTENLTSV